MLVRRLCFLIVVMSASLVAAAPVEIAPAAVADETVVLAGDGWVTPWDATTVKVVAELEATPSLVPIPEPASTLVILGACLGVGWIAGKRLRKKIVQE